MIIYFLILIIVTCSVAVGVVFASIHSSKTQARKMFDEDLEDIDKYNVKFYYHTFSERVKIMQIFYNLKYLKSDFQRSQILTNIENKQTYDRLTNSKKG